jgi:hypothetical protein
VFCLSNLSHSSQLSKIKTYFQIVQHTRKPEYIREMATKFLSEKLSGPYMALHYRYDAIEWSNVCARPQKGRKGEVCDVLEKTGSKGKLLTR